MRKLFVGLVIIVVLLGVAAFILSILIPTSVYKYKITEQVSSALGREVQITGDVKLSVFPTLTAKADLVTIANVDGFSDQKFATMDSLKANVRLMPLFKKQVEIKSFTLVNPKISLEKTKDGQVNWVFGEQTAEPTQQAKGAFARDGRYTDLQISLGTFALENGSINYSDAQTGANYDLHAINMKLSMPGLDKSVNAKGDMVVNDMPVDIEVELDTPKVFLNGEAAPVVLKFKSDLISISANGRFTPSSIITFDVDLDADIPSTSKLDAFLKQSNPYGTLTETASIKGNLSFDGLNMVGTGTEVSLKSDILTTDFTGNFSVGGIPSASGDLKVNIADIKKLQDALGMAIPQLQAFNTVDISASLDTDGKITNAENISINIKGDNITASYTGAAKFDNALSLAGKFSANSPSLPALLPKIGVNGLAQANIFGDLSLSSEVNGMVDALILDDLDFKTKGGDLVLNYTGQVKLGENLSLNGRFDAAAPSLKTLAETGEIVLPYADALDALKASGTLNGPASALTISDVKAALTGGMLNLDFVGNVTAGKTPNYDGSLKLDIPSLRLLAAVGGITLAADTDAGRVYGNVFVTGRAKGNMAKVSFSGANIRFDNLTGHGDFTANLTNKPYITGNLDMQGLDIRPYQAAMYADRPKGVQPWSEEPLNMSFLNMFNGTFTLNTPNIIMSSMEMGQSILKSTVKNGVLKTNIPNVSLFGGKGRLDMELDASSAVPQVALDFTFNNVNGQDLLGAVANFTKLSGNTGTTMSIKGAGRSQAEIMRSLSGGGNFELAEGIVTGVDIKKFMSNFNGINSILQTRELPEGIGSSYSTPFNKIAGLFTVNNGVITIGDFALTANNVFAEGGGKLDLGQQRVDFSLRPRLKNGRGLAGFGIPIKFSGNFGGIKAGLDSDLMTKIVAARAKVELQNQLSKQVGGDLGGIIGGLLGTPQPQQQSQGHPQKTTGNPEDPLIDLLGNIVENNKTDGPPKSKETENEKDKKEEDPLEKALMDLFGGN